MEYLEAPWRGDYIRSDKDEDDGDGKTEGGEKRCIFCDLPAEGEAHYRRNLILTCSPSVFVILNRYPYNNFHLMVIPRRHVSRIHALNAHEYRVLSETLRESSRLLEETVKPEGMNIGLNLGQAAGAGIGAHCHYHLVPRWYGDTNFMTVTGRTRVVNIDLEATYDELFPVFDGLATQIEGA